MMTRRNIYYLETIDTHEIKCSSSHHHDNMWLHAYIPTCLPVTPPGNKRHTWLHHRQNDAGGRTGSHSLCTIDFLVTTKMNTPTLTPLKQSPFLCRRMVISDVTTQRLLRDYLKDLLHSTTLPSLQTPSRETQIATLHALITTKTRRALLARSPIS
jgi:hypothetical protein